MTRLLAAALACLMSALAVSSACVAADTSPMRFILTADEDPTKVEADFRVEGTRHNRWSTEFRFAQLSGLSPAAFHASGTRPVRFAVIRDSGRFDCSGHGGNGRASGNCGFSPDAAFAGLLQAHAIARPSASQWISLFALDVQRGLIGALASARYPTPTPDDLVTLTAVGVSPRYVVDMGRAGYRPSKLDTLVQLRALDVTPQWIGELARLGYAGVPASDLVQMKALNVTARDIRGFQALGYRNLRPSDLVQMKAVGVTPEFARAVHDRHGTVPPDRLVQLRVVGDLASDR